jgi:hypothetical protein
MTVYDLVDLYEGEIVSNKAQVRIDGEWIVVGHVVGDAFELTAEGEELAAKGAEATDSGRKKKEPNEPVGE